MIQLNNHRCLVTPLFFYHYNYHYRYQVRIWTSPILATHYTTFKYYKNHQTVKLNQIKYSCCYPTHFRWQIPEIRVTPVFVKYIFFCKNKVSTKLLTLLLRENKKTLLLTKLLQNCSSVTNVIQHFIQRQSKCKWWFVNHTRQGDGWNLQTKEGGAAIWKFKPVSEFGDFFK